MAIVGRPNVGKSTLFNRMVGRRRAIVGDEPGITRDRLYGEVRWNGRRFRVVDTGGIVPDDKAWIPAEIFRQARVALDEAAAIVMVVDGRTELASPDMELARQLLRSGKPLFLAVNKIDTPKLDAQAENYRSLGLQRLFAVSAEHGNGVAELIEGVMEFVPTIEDKGDEGARHEQHFFRARAVPTEEAESREEQNIANGKHGVMLSELDAFDEGVEVPHEEPGPPPEIKVSIIGRPNVGKSTLLNQLVGTARAIVSPIAGTTRDAIDEVVEKEGQKYRFIDTAGIRRKGKTELMAEKLSVVMARKHLESADVALVLIDAVEGVTALDANIAGYAHEAGRSVIIVINKWDLVTTERKDGKPPAENRIFEEQARRALKFLPYAPMIFTSAVSGKNVHRVFAVLQRVAAERRKRISTGEMNRFLNKIDFERASVPSRSNVRIYYMTQAAVAPPTFILFTDRQVKLHFSYERFVENQIREEFGFEGTPIWLKVRARKKRDFVPKVDSKKAKYLEPKSKNKRKK